MYREIETDDNIVHKIKNKKSTAIIYFQDYECFVIMCSGNGAAVTAD